jgi:hypothetical protein
MDGAIVLSTVLFFLIDLIKMVLNKRVTFHALLPITGLVFVFHYLVHSHFSFIAPVNYLAKIYIAFKVASALKSDFIKVFVKLMTFFALASLPFYLLVCLGVDFGFEFGRHRSLFFYDYVPGDVIRNNGPFWEAGVFSIYLNLALLFLNYRALPYSSLYRIALIIAVLTTTSTTGFALLIMNTIIYFLRRHANNWLPKYLGFAMVILLSLTVWKLDFIGSKIDEQFNEAVLLSEDDVRWSRFGSFVIDWHYIKQRPIIGNGLSLKSRYRDHVGKYSNKQLAGFGNGLSGFVAAMGIPLLLTFLYFSTRHLNLFREKIVFTIFILVALFGQQLLNFPLFWILPFLNYEIVGSNHGS